MSKKMWNKIFKNKPLKTQSAAAKSTSIDNNRYSYYEEFYSTCTVPSSKVSVAPATGKSKFSFANSFSLKRNSKENNSRKSNSNSKSKSNAKTLNNSDDLSATRDVSPTRIIDTIDNLEPIKAVIDSKNLTIPEAPEKLDLHPCRICNRTFVQKTLSKHVIICEKAAIKKRRQFDSLRQRTEGTELADYLPKKFGMPITKVPGHERSISPNPRALVTVEKSEPEELSIKEPEYVSAPPVEEIKEAVSRKVVHAPPGKSTTNVRQKPTAPHREPLRKRIQQPESNQCPHCQRFFGVKAYERHYIWCKEKSLNIANKNTGISQAAKDRLDARNNYRVPNLKTKRAVNREKYSGTNDEDDTLSNSKVMCTSLGSSFMSDGGLSDKYDPFQSAKRQLEELCSPTSSYQQQKFVQTPLTKSLPRSRLSPGKTITSYSSFNPPLTNPKAALNTIKSNFRRTSSLRSPRKASFLSSRPVYQPSNVRPTVQRGLSDEGPISSNFLRPEEYDEMPVRSVCSNDFAITNSPRVLRRDSSASNRRNLNLNLTKENTVSPTQNKQVLKTDSLAIFLKYENEAKTIESPVTAKDLKDKSNTLSKQNSAKSIIGDIQEKLTGDETDKITNMPTPLSQPKRNDTCMTINKVHSIRLDPLPKQLMINNHSTPKHSPQLKQMADVFADSTLSSSINLNSILDTKNISDDFIDPQLINDIDNLPINVTKLSSDSDLTSNISSDIGHRKFSISDTESQYNDSQCQIQEYEQLKQQQQKHIHHHQQQQQQQNVQHHQQEQEKPQTQQNDEFQYKPLADSNRNSADSRILLKRKMRVGRNQFLYDASPDSDLDNRSFDSNDEPQNNNTSTKFNMNVKSQINPPNIPPFDEFDFEEFLTSFENDSDQFPLFKDCREFLMNRSFSKQSSSSNKSNKTNKESSSCSSDSSNNNKNIDKNLIHNNINDNYGMLFDRSSPKQICEKKQSHIDEDKRHEIFISIETDHDNDDSINSSHGNSNSLPGKSSAFVEEIDANDNKFTKIIDDGTTGDYNINPKNSNKFPDVKRNNAKNLMMHDYHSTNSKHESDNKIHLNKHSSIGNVAKRGSDSDNGSVSRQSSESQLPSIVKKRPSTATTPENLRYQQSFVKYPPSHEQNRSIGHSASSSSSENSLPPINSLASMDILMKSLKVSAYNETKKTDTNSSSSVSTTSTKTVTPKQIKKLKKDNTLLAMQSSSNTSNSNSRLSKFCHECGSKFLLETAKFCMECGVKRMNV